MYGCGLHSSARQEDSHGHQSRDPGSADVQRRPARPDRAARQHAGRRAALRRTAVLRLGAALPARAGRRPALQRPGAAQAGIDVSVASRQIAVLERSGYVERRPDPVDGRANLLSLTPAGVETIAATRALRQDWALSALASWDEGDARILSDLLDRLVADLETAGAPKGSAARAAVPAPR